MQKSRRMRTTRSHQAKSPPACVVPSCRRQAYARGLCQTHHRQLITTGTLKPIRPYRARSPNTIKFSGLRLSAGAASQVDRKATREGRSRGATITSILEEWARRGAKPPSDAA